MVQWWIERLRDRRADQVKSVAAVKERASAEVREALADYDAFVGPMRAVKDGLRVGTARSSGGDEVPVHLAWGEEYAHWLVQGGTGTGKTTWVGSLLRQELEAGRPIGVIDCKGDLFRLALRLVVAIAHQLPERERETLRGRVVVVNPFGEYLVPLNVCAPLPGSTAEVQAFEVTLALSRLFDAALGVHMESILRHLLILLIEARLSLVEAPQVLEDGVLGGLLAMRSSHPAVREFFLQAWPSVPQPSKDALVSRLRSLLLPENVRLMLGADDVIDLREILDEGRPMFVFLGKGAGVPEEQVEVLGNLFVQLFLQAVWARGSGNGTPYLLALDEFFHLLEAPTLVRRFETALTTVRSFGLSLMLIHHNFAQLPTSLREMMLGNCDLVALFRTGGRNALFFGDFLPEIDPASLARAGQGGRGDRSRETIRRSQLEAVQRMAQRELFWYDRRQPYRSIRVRAADVPAPDRITRLTERQLEDRLHEERWDCGALARPRGELAGQLAARQERLRALLRPSAVIPKASPTPRAPKGRKPRLG
jgi:hypothetical protein